MQRFFFLLACFAGIGHSRNDEQQETSQDAAQSLRSLRSFLFARGPAARFGKTVRAVSGQSARHMKSPVASTELGNTSNVEPPFDVKQLAGITAPLGFFDPLGFTTDKSEGKIRFLREVELKHSRLVMLAALGFLVGENFHPLFGGNIDEPAYLAFQQTPLQTFWPVVVLGISILETFSVFTFNSPVGGEPWSIRSDHVPGNLGFDWDRVALTDPEYFKTMQTKELNNGRLAMLAAAGMILQEYATGQKLF
jgi:light-harvesting complex I chlorophyll a/b binding protein 4